MRLLVLIMNIRSLLLLFFFFLFILEINLHFTGEERRLIECPTENRGCGLVGVFDSGRC